MKKLLCAGIVICMILCMPLAANAAEGSITAGGWNETIWAKITGIRDADITAVSYSGTSSGELLGEDLQYLVRGEADHVRVDIPGVPAGTYTLTVTTSKGVLVAENIQVEAQDRSGYAHFGYEEGVGAYHDDGTLKENAIVLYVTQENKDAVSITSKDGTTVVGIGNILNSRGRSSSGGSLTNSNQDILRKLASDGTPLVVRILGMVTLPQGLTAYNSNDYGGSVGDNGAMARMQGGKDITIEGIGVGAGIDGWGLHFICGGGDYARGWGKSFEVRNLTFRNVPEDCVGMEGEQDGAQLNAPVERCWIHHCAFYAPVIANPAESDKAGGDGACDFKRGQYFTNSYCYYEGYHKTNLVGGSDSNLQYHITYHHNYWKNCESRGPLARQANIHMYNNIFENQSSYCMNPRANAYIFSEYNLFINSKNPVRVTKGAVKSYQDQFQNCRGDHHATIVADKTSLVDTACKYANFDTDSTLSYIPAGDYLLHDSISAMQEVVMVQAGPQKRTEPAEDVPVHTHTYAETVVKAATCTEKGEAVYACQCGDRHTKIMPMIAHSYETQVLQPDCTQGGGVVHSCTVCGKSYTDAPTASLGHSYGGDHLCIRCGEKDPDAPLETEPTQPTIVPATTQPAPVPTQPIAVPTMTQSQNPAPQDNGNHAWIALLAVIAAVAVTGTVWILRRKK